jgi:hypothetical protein
MLAPGVALSAVLQFVIGLFVIGYFAPLMQTPAAVEPH